MGGLRDAGSPSKPTPHVLHQHPHGKPDPRALVQLHHEIDARSKMLRTGRTGTAGTAGTGGAASGVMADSVRRQNHPEGSAPRPDLDGRLEWGGAECQAPPTHPTGETSRWEFVLSNTNCNSELAPHFSLLNDLIICRLYA